MVEQIGREKLLSAPVFRVEEFDNGGIMLQIHEHPISDIKWPYRKRIMDHLGLKPKKLEPPKIPEWLSRAKKPPTRIKVDKKREVSVVVGVNADDLDLGGNLSLYRHYVEKVHPRVKAEVDEAIAFAKWFNGLDLGLEAFISGTSIEDEYEVYVGRRGGGLLDYKGHDRVDAQGLTTMKDKVVEAFDKLGFKVEPSVQLLLYDVGGK